MNHETKHEPSHSAGTPQSPETGGNQQRVSANRAACEAIARAFPYRDSDYIGEVEFIGLREISYARACRSRAAVLCASTDAEDAALACAIFVACRAAEIQAKPAADAARAVYAFRSREAEEPPCPYCGHTDCVGECYYD